MYLQLYENIKNDILSGKIAPGERLPGKRTLASHLNISVITVENAYSQLVTEGYIKSFPKKGFFVEELISPERKSDGINIDNTLKEIVMPDEDDEGWFADFSSNGISQELLPIKTWSKIWKDSEEYIKNNINKKIPTGGTPLIREAISDYLSRFREIDAVPEQIIVGAGSEYLYSLIVQMLSPSKVFAIENPGYTRLVGIYNAMGAKCIYADILNSKKSISSELSNSGADIVHVSPSHHFPTGRVMPISKRYELLGWVNESESRYIIEDDYDAEFRFSGRPVPPLYSIDAMEKVIYLNTFSKSISPTIRISYMVLPPSLVRVFYEKLGFLKCSVSLLNQYFLATFLKEGYFERHINKSRAFYRKKRDSLLSAFKSSPMSKLCEISEESSGLHFLLQIKTDTPDSILKAKLLDKKIKISSLSDFYNGSAIEMQHIFIVKYGNIDDKKISEAVKRFSDVVCSSI